jgi:hypothetical protein
MPDLRPVDFTPRAAAHANVAVHLPVTLEAREEGNTVILDTVTGGGHDAIAHLRAAMLSRPVAI